jgi:hypothetical protein
MVESDIEVKEKTIEELVEIKPYLDVLYELIEIDFNVVYLFIVGCDRPDDVSLENSYRLVVTSFFKDFYIYNNKNNIKKQLQKAYAYIKYTQKIGPNFDQEVWQLIKIYYQGRLDGTYNSLKSLAKAHQLDPYGCKYFKEHFMVFMGYYHGFNSKINSDPLPLGSDHLRGGSK